MSELLKLVAEAHFYARRLRACLINGFCQFDSFVILHKEEQK